MGFKSYVWSTSGVGIGEGKAGLRERTMSIAPEIAYELIPLNMILVVASGALVTMP